MIRSALAQVAAFAVLLMATACTPPPPAADEGIAPSAAACQKTGQQCRIGGSGALGVCHSKPEAGGWACTPQH